MIGKLRHRITFIEPNRVQNQIGEWVEDWKQLDTVWAAVEPLRGRTYFEAKQSTADVDGKITIRYKDVNPIWQIVWNDWEGKDRVFKIVSIVQPQQRGKFTEILYREDLD